MMQKEVGLRLTAKPNTKEYGYITVLLNYFYDINLLFNVNKTSFYPVPNVDSVVVKFTPKNNKQLDFQKFDNFLKQAFKYKRKNLKNNLKNYDLKKIEKILTKHSFTLSSRAENLPLEVFIDLVDNL
jgi:16S rRNA (adenine1518-N6/adenine1519-N6)-dimethyltransferase